MKKFLSYVGLVHLLILLSVGAFHKFFNVSRDSGYLVDPKNKRQWVDRIKGTQFDYAVLGSSRAHGAFDMNFLDSLLELKGVNIGADGSGYLDNLLTLTRFLKNGNSVKYLFLVIDASSLNSKASLSTPFHPFDYLSQDQVPSLEDELTKQINGKEGILFEHLRALYLLKYNMQSIRLSLKNRFKGKSNLDFFNVNKGGVALTHDEVFGNTGSAKIASTFAIEDLEYLNQIVRFCSLRNIQLATFSSPIFLNLDEVSDKEMSESKIEVEVNKLESDYIKSPKDISLKIDNFKDRGHLNNKGIQAYTLRFSKEIKEFIEGNTR